MSTSPREQESTELKAGGIGPLRDLQQVRAGTSASLAEMREFLAQLKGRRPQEVIGIVSASLLMQSLVLAAILVVVMLFVFTVGPYIVYGPPQPKNVATPKPAAAATAQNPAASTESPTAPATLETVPSTVNAEQATKVMGLDEAKPADPTENPLDSPDLDKLLDGID